MIASGASAGRPAWAAAGAAGRVQWYTTTAKKGETITTDHITRRFCFRYHAAGVAINLAAQEVSHHSNNRCPAEKLSPEAYRAISDDISSRLPGAAAYCIDSVIADYTGRNSYTLTVSGTVDYPRQ